MSAASPTAGWIWAVIGVILAVCLVVIILVIVMANSPPKMSMTSQVR